MPRSDDRALWRTEIIRKNMEEKCTAELIEILERRDKKEWSEDAFQAIREVIAARSVSPHFCESCQTNVSPAADGTCPKCQKSDLVSNGSPMPGFQAEGLHFAKAYPVIGALCVAAIPVLYLALAFIRYALMDNSRSNPLGDLLVDKVFLVVIAIAWGLCWKASKRCFQTHTVARFLTDTRRPIIYLRPFSTDSAWSSAAPGPAEKGDKFMPVPMSLVRTAARTEEGDLMPELEKVGGVLAVGRPNELIPPLGAPRLYISNSRWQELVGLLVHASKIVFVRPGNADGMRWELYYLREYCDPVKLILFFPPVYDADRHQTIPIVEECLRINLPRSLVQSDNFSRPFFFCISAGWEAVLLSNSYESLGLKLTSHLNKEAKARDESSSRQQQKMQEQWEVIRFGLRQVKR